MFEGSPCDVLSNVEEGKSYQATVRVKGSVTYDTLVGGSNTAVDFEVTTVTASAAGSNG